VTEISGCGQERGFVEKRQRIVAVAERYAKRIGKGGKDAVADELFVGLVAVGIRVD
jgi:hypothetical protein